MKILLLMAIFAPFAAEAQEFNSIRHERKIRTVSIRVQAPRADTPHTDLPDAPAASAVPKAREKPAAAKMPEVRRNAPNGFASPLEVLRVTSGYGMRLHPITRKRVFHAGIDLAAAADTVWSVLDGIVAAAGYGRHMGHCVSIAHGEYTTAYAHLSQYFVLEGEAVHCGQPIGITGSTGASTGEHLHFAVRHRGTPMDPLAFLKKLYRANIFMKTLKTDHDERHDGEID